MRYNDAPIREAVFDIRVDKLSTTKSAEDLKAFKEVLSSEYKKVQRKLFFQGGFTISESAPSSTAKSDLVGFTFMNEDQTRQIQVRLDGFTFNVLNPYDSWDIHFAEFFSYWKSYNELFSPENVIRIAARFINKIELPYTKEGFDFDDYIVNMPSIPESLPQSFLNFFMQVQVASSNQQLRINLTETMEPPQKDFVPFILDIDVIRDKDISIKNLESQFDEIREQKNLVFESCITDETRELFS